MILPDSLLFATTDLGESAVVAAAATVGTLYLWAYGYRKAALGLMLSFVITSIAIGVLKVFFLSCAPPDSNILSPSGHVALSTAVFGTYAALISAQTSGARSFIPWVIVLLLVAAIAATRIILGFHSQAEVILGLCTGGFIASALYWMLLRGDTPARFDVRILVTVTLAAAILFHGTKLPSEALIRALVLHIKRHALLCSA